MTRLHVRPEADAALREGLRQQGAVLVGEDEQPEGIIVTGMFKTLNLAEVLEANPQVRWVQLPSAGIELYAEILTQFPELTWTSAKGSYAKPVGEHALALTLAALRGLKARALANSWGTEGGISLNGLRCVVVGGGGVAAEIVRLYKAFDTHVTVVRRTAEPVEHADVTVAFEGLDEALDGAEVVALAAAATPATRHLLNADRLALLADGAVVANVGRGSLVDQTALVEALSTGALRGAGLDVTEPEPLPETDPLWSLQNCLITPHTADTTEMVVPLLRERILANHRRFHAGEPMLGLVDPAQGY
ncbi:MULTISPECIES: NAD(P)-dependent oxidoreductase [unclassified Nesterenkonia]|uniref:NAD(P)-dependent oxidoreductase n=1 Tax=unclassified Nesterenkonia TaxID=2629769 RepID=UPI001F4CFD65|nr:MULTISPECIES: NAD(P)-dependent oxidoreductase [unclassified Nesterenkonia]MCH8560271.1 hydroxyacid dehydrogenase [Nesterenkonia sp. DZ6]MCH8563725.1 hydroxyacid dehydrogenase [Nesterenkonia sp. YGD6]